MKMNLIHLRDELIQYLQTDGIMQWCLGASKIKIKQKTTHQKLIDSIFTFEDM